MVNKMMNNSFKQNIAKQKGAVLITGLIFLVVLTLFVLSVMRSATLEERMSGNARNRQIALQAAEAVIRDAEESVLGTIAASPIDPMNLDDYTADCTKGFCSEDATKWTSIDWSDTSATAPTRTFSTPATGTALSLAGVASPPRYYIEKISEGSYVAGAACPKVLYRITARGIGPDSSTVVIQTNFRRQPSKYIGKDCG